MLFQSVPLPPNLKLHFQSTRQGAFLVECMRGCVIPPWELVSLFMLLTSAELC